MKYITSYMGRYGAEYLVALVLLGVHTLVISLPHKHAVLASSNLMTNLIRMDAREEITAESSVLAGSSITGRLLGEYFSATTETVANVGLDGCGSMEAAQAVVESGKFPAKMIIEINTLKPGFADNFQKVSDAQSRLRQVLQHTLPFMATKERPVDVAYYALHEWKDQATGSNELIAWSNDAILPTDTTAPEPATDDAKGLPAYLENCHSILTTLHQHGVKLAFALYPADATLPAKDRFEFHIATAITLGKQHAIPVLDLRKCGRHEQLRFTDGVHLSAPSARAVCQLIEAQVLPLAR
jgi:hypothetical protein